MTTFCATNTPGIDLTADPSTGGLMVTPVASLDADNGLEIRGDGFYAPDRPAFVSALPTVGNYGGREVFYDALTGLITWHFRYHGTTSSSNHWQFVGGAPLFASAAGPATQTGASGQNYDDVIGSSFGPVQVTAPIQGVYDIRFGGRINNSAVANSYLSVKYGAAGATDNDAVVAFGSTNTSVDRLLRVTIGANTAVALRFRNDTGSTSVTWSQVYLAVTPVRV